MANPAPDTADAPRGGGENMGQRKTSRAFDAYTIVDHTYDVVVVGAGGSGLRATMGAAEAGLAHREHLQGLSHPLAHRGGAGRDRREPGQ